MSPAAGRFESVDAGVMPVMAWLSVRSLFARRMRDSKNRDRPFTVEFANTFVDRRSQSFAGDLVLVCDFFLIDAVRLLVGFDPALEIRDVPLLQRWIQIVVMLVRHLHPSFIDY
jgi:hypothetical protein